MHKQRMRMIVALIALTYVTISANSSAPIITLGVLEDVPGVYVGEPNRHKVRAVFLKAANEWKPFVNQCPDQSCLKTIPSQFPSEVTWTVAFDGRSLGRVTSRTPDKSKYYSHIGLQEITSTSPLPTVGKRSPEYSGFLYRPVYRPLVVNSQPYFSDPEAWKPAQISADVMRGLRQQFRKKFQTVTNCTKEDVENPKLWNYQDSDIKLIKAYSSKNRWSVARIRLEENLCDGIPGDDFVDHWFVIDPAGKIDALGQEMWLVDAGDYDNDGKSEILFSINAYDRGGYVLFYDDFAKHATFEFIYH